jgi:hypothetical protein
MRAKLKRRVGRGILAETELGLFAHAPEVRRRGERPAEPTTPNGKTDINSQKNLSGGDPSPAY